MNVFQDDRRRPVIVLADSGSATKLEGGIYAQDYPQPLLAVFRYRYKPRTCFSLLRRAVNISKTTTRAVDGVADAFGTSLPN
jgi:hypothetical protein